MTTKIFSLSIFVFLTTLLPNLSHGSIDIQENSDMGTELKSKNLEIPQRTPTNLALRISAITPLFDRYTESPPETILNELENWGSKAFQENKTNWGRPISSTPHLAVRYNPQFDDLLVLSTELLNSVPEAIDASSPEQIGDSAEREKLEQALQEETISQPDAHTIAIREAQALISAGIIAESEYDWENVRISSVNGGFGRDGIDAIEWIDEYTFSFQRIFDGIPVYGSGLRIGIHRKGQLSSVRISGMDIDSPNTSKTQAQ